MLLLPVLQRKLWGQEQVQVLVLVLVASHVPLLLLQLRLHLLAFSQQPCRCDLSLCL